MQVFDLIIVGTGPSSAGALISLANKQKLHVGILDTGIKQFKKDKQLKSFKNKYFKSNSSRIIPGGWYLMELFKTLDISKIINEKNNFVMPPIINSQNNNLFNTDKKFKNTVNVVMASKRRGKVQFFVI